ncbi:SDR family oxidoreductase [Jannaschia sp. LMIT008]|uniref:SDR family NAD(P)-dependent oxidoreductase n=1 Tax=Jannaschia maritima TaxID=3032585 RepID=UPI0028111B0E|nr:SDR family oxidoreductase [Jannaschia sp. LMIT008]
MTQTLALITGASGGIGLELARLHARKGGDLLLVARRGDVLDDIAADLRQAHGVTVDTVAADLTTLEGVRATVAAAEGRPVEVLINNAGYGGRGLFVERDLSDDLAMVDLNVKALMVLCHSVGAAMVARGRGRILNVASTAGMMPGPLQATYFASKAFVRSFSFALAEEMRGTGVTVTALSPGYVVTGFAARADLDGTDLTKSGRSAASVAKVGYDAMRLGKLEVVNEPALSFASKAVLPFVPTRALMRMVRKMQTK